MAKYLSNFINSKIIFCLMTILILVLFIVIGILSYKVNQINKEIHHIYTEKIVMQPSNNITKNENIPIYPKELPQYDRNVSEYQHIGLLTANEDDKEPIVLPLFARKVINNRDRWQYYTATDKNNMMRLPLVYQNMNCDEDIGCREIYDGDKVTIEIYRGRIFTATIYKTDTPKYFADKF